MRFWDSSALVPLLVGEATSPTAMELRAEDPDLIVGWASPVECASALARRERSGELEADVVAEAFARLDALADAWYEVEPGDAARETARRFLRVHDLRAADAMQLAAAFLASEHRPPSLELVSFDDRLCAAARREGFVVLDSRSSPATPS